jgi:geranylgeranyl transferase type-2 subunit alpha
MLGLVGPSGRATIAPALTLEDRVAYVLREIDEIKELLEDYQTEKLIYEALFDYTLYLCQLEERQPDGVERADLVAWLGKLRELDPMRNGRWADLERDCELKEGGE